MQFSSLLLLLLGASTTTYALGLSDAPIRRAGAGPPPAAPAAPRPAAPPSLPAAPKPVAPPSAPRPPKPNRPDVPDSPDAPDGPDDRTDNDSTTRIFRPYTSIVRTGQASRTTIQTSTSTSTTNAFRAVNTGAGSRVYADSGVMVLISVVVAAVA